MTLPKICAVLIMCSLVLLILSRTEKELSTVLSISIYVSFTTYTITRFYTIFETFSDFLEKFNLFDAENIFKISGILIISSIAIYVCDTSGQKGLASNIETLCMIEVLILFFPTFKSIFLKIINLIGE